VAKAKKKAATKKPQEVLVVGSKVKALLKDAGCNTGGDVIEAVNGYVHWLVGQAAERAHANGRKTVRAHDVVLM
jgi:histone H3/H4